MKCKNVPSSSCDPGYPGFAHEHVSHQLTECCPPPLVTPLVPPLVTALGPHQPAECRWL